MLPGLSRLSGPGANTTVYITKCVTKLLQAGLVLRQYPGSIHTSNTCILSRCQNSSTYGPSSACLHFSVSLLSADQQEETSPESASISFLLQVSI